jgi:hypothetical protein
MDIRQKVSRRQQYKTWLDPHLRETVPRPTMTGAIRVLGRGTSVRYELKRRVMRKVRHE